VGRAVEVTEPPLHEVARRTGAVVLTAAGDRQGGDQEQRGAGAPHRDQS
jgi:hypothetical protein